MVAAHFDRQHCPTHLTTGPEHIGDILVRVLAQHDLRPQAESAASLSPLLLLDPCLGVGNVAHTLGTGRALGATGFVYVRAPGR